MVYQVAAGYVAGRAASKKGKMGRRAETERKGKQAVEIGSNFGEGGGDWADMMRNYEQQWLDAGLNPGDISEHLRNHPQLMLANLLRTDAARDVMDVNRMTDLAYQPAAGVMERGTQGAIESTRGAMALSGMGQSTAMPALEGSMRMQAAGNRGNLYQSMLLQNLQSRYNMQQNVVAMGMGMTPAPMGGGGGGGMDWSQLAGALGGAAGAFAGAGGGGGGGGGGGYQGDPGAGQWSNYGATRPGSRY